MINFFRRIRQQLLSENKFSKYLIYAIGEIILVVIGILIALQINTWNNNRIQKNKEANFITQIHNEFLQNRTQFDTVTSYHLKVKNGASKLIALFPIDINTVNKDALSNYIKDTFWDWTFNPQQTSINSLTNSSSFEIMSNAELKAQLEQWNELIKDYNEEEMYSKKFGTTQYYPYMRKRITNRAYGTNTSIFNHEAIDLKFLNDLEFENLVYGRRIGKQDILNESKAVSDAINKIIELTRQN